MQHRLSNKYKAFDVRSLDRISQLSKVPPDLLRKIEAVAQVLPFRVNNYVLDELIDWDHVPEDPIFQLTFPQPGMLNDLDLKRMIDLLKTDADRRIRQRAAQRIQLEMNPHPAKQMELNVPVEGGRTYNGLQHKYKEIVLVFPREGQTCHAFCTYCFRWAQFCGLDKLRFENRDPELLLDYLSFHPEVTDVLFTGGDPLMMHTKLLRRYVEPLLEQRARGLKSIRFGTKVPAYWPYRFLTDRDADDLMRLFEKIVSSGLHLAIMVHFSHYRELQTVAVEKAIKRLRSTGATIRCQAPLVRHVNDRPEIWARMWERQVQLGAVPYYMFIARDTGPKKYFEVPLASAYKIFTEAYSQVSGLCRTVRGPSMSATPGKVLIDGIGKINGKKFFILKFIQGRNPEWVNRPFYAEYNESATWLDDLKPAFEKSPHFFYQPGLEAITEDKESA